MQRLLPPRLFLLTLVAMTFAHWAWPHAVLPSGSRWLGVVLLAIGLGFAITGARHFARVRTNIKTFNAPDQLVTDGLFRWSRNPMYLGFVTALAGVATMLGSLAPWLCVLAFFVISDRWYIAFEERVMERTFGEAYRSYRAHTRRWV